MSITFSTPLEVPREELDAFLYNATMNACATCRHSSQDFVNGVSCLVFSWGGWCFVESLECSVFFFGGGRRRFVCDFGGFLGF